MNLLAFPKCFLTTLDQLENETDYLCKNVQLSTGEERPRTKVEITKFNKKFGLIKATGKAYVDGTLAVEVGEMTL